MGRIKHICKFIVSWPFVRTLVLSGFCLAVAAWFVWFRFFSTNQFVTAMKEHDYARAEKLWKVGVHKPETEPYTEFMLFLARLRAVKGVEVPDYNIQGVGHGRYVATIAVREVREGEAPRLLPPVVFAWRDGKWTFFVDREHHPDYVRESLR